jgi:hypothetical protein
MPWCKNKVDPYLCPEGIHFALKNPRPRPYGLDKASYR